MASLWYRARQRRGYRPLLLGIAGPGLLLAGELAIGSEVGVLDMKDTAVSQRARQLGIRRVPAVVINSALEDCCAGRGATEQALRAAGIGQAD